MKYLHILMLFLISFVALAVTENTGHFDNITTNNPAKIKVDVLKTLNLGTTDGVYLPSGTTVQRPSPTKDGMLRFNSSLGQAEIYIAGSWTSVGGGLSAWVTAKAYVIGDVVIQSNKIYKALIAHTSGTFATDLGAGDWVEVSAPQDLTGPITSSGGVSSVASQTGTGSTFVMQTSPSLVTPNIGVASGTSLSVSGQLASTVATGTAPLAVASTTKVVNLYADRAALADTATTNANLTGPITSVGNATSVASQTGTGSKFVMDTSPTLVTPNIGAASGSSLSVSGRLTSTVATGTAPLAVTSTTKVTNLYADRAALADIVTTNANLTGAVTSTGNATSLGSFSSSNLSTALTDETGTGSAVFATSPTLVTPTLGDATGTSLALGGTLGSAAVLDVQSTSKGFLPPRMTQTQRDAIASPVAGLTVYNTTSNTLDTYNGSLWIGALQSGNYDWTSYTPTLTNFGTTSPTTNQCKHKREGSDLLVQCFFTAGTVSANPSISIPSGLTIDTSKLISSAATTGPNQTVGSWANNGANLSGFALVAPGTSTTNIYIGAGTTSAGLLASSSGTPYPTSSAALSINFRVPISGWANTASTINDVPTVPGMGTAAIKMATITCKASPTITFPSGQASWATVAAGSGTTANYSCTVTMSGYNNAPFCTSSGQSGNKTVSFTVNSSTSATAYCTSAGSNCSTSDIQQVVCIGN